MGQREENRGNRDEAERHAAARCDGGGRYGRRSVQGHVVGGAQPGDQVHHAVWIAGGGAGGSVDGGSGSDGDARVGCGILRGVVLLRVPVVLRHANQGLLNLGATSYNVKTAARLCVGRPFYLFNGTS